MIIQIKLQSVEKHIKNYLNFLIKILKSLNIAYKALNLPTKHKKLTILKSPHVNKKAREQFEIKKHTKILEINVEKKQDLKISSLLLNKPKYIKLKIRRII